MTKVQKYDARNFQSIHFCPAHLKGRSNSALETIAITATIFLVMNMFGVFNLEYENASFVFRMKIFSNLSIFCTISFIPDYILFKA